MFVLALAILAYHSAEAAEDDSSKMIEILKEAQKANESRYPSGEIRFSYTRSQVGRSQDGVPSVYERSEMHMIWAGEKAWRQVERWARHKCEVDPSSHPPTEKVFYLVDAKKLTAVYPSMNKAFVDPMVWGSLPVELMMRPATSWYTPWGFAAGRLTWGKILDPSSLPKVAPSAIHFQVTEEAGNVVRVLRSEDERGGEVRAAFSLPLDGNVIEYGFREPTSGYESKGSCIWERDAKGRLYLKRSDYEATSDFKGRKHVIKHRYDTLYFDPDYPGLFTGH